MANVSAGKLKARVNSVIKLCLHCEVAPETGEEVLLVVNLYCCGQCCIVVNDWYRIFVLLLLILKSILLPALVSKSKSQ